MSDNIVSNLDIKSYLLLLRELRQYYNKKFNLNISHDVDILSISYNNNNSKYGIIIKSNINGNICRQSISNHFITERELISILRKIKLNKLCKIKN